MSDSTAPTLTAVSIASNNSTKTDYACYLDGDIVTLTITFFYHNIFKYPAIFWYKIGNVFHKFLSPIILFIVYIFSIVLIGMMMKIFRKDSLNRKINYKVDSYWLKSKDKDIHNCNLNDQF